MNQPIVFTAQEFYNIILAICAGIMSMSGAIAVIVKAIGKVRQPEEKQNERISALENEVAQIEDRLKLGNKRFEVDREHIEKIEMANVVTQRALLALLSHSINGNDIESLKKAKGDLEEYLTEQKNEKISQAQN